MLQSKFQMLLDLVYEPPNWQKKKYVKKDGRFQNTLLSLFFTNGKMELEESTGGTGTTGEDAYCVGLSSGRDTLDPQKRTENLLADSDA